MHLNYFRGKLLRHANFRTQQKTSNQAKGI